MCPKTLLATDVLGRIAALDARASTLIASQLPVTDWHAVIGDTNQAAAIGDRLLHDAHRIDLKGRSMRRTHDAPANRRKETT